MPPEAPPSSASGPIYQVLVELPTGEVRLEPVLALGGGLAEVAYRGPTGTLRPGATLTHVQVFADGLRVLSCPASVQDLQGEGQEAILTLALQTAREEADAPIQQNDLITETVQSLLEARASASLTIDGATLPGQAFLARAEADPQRLVIEVQLPEGTALPAPGRVCEVTCLLFGARVVLLAKVHGHKAGRRATSELHLRWPHTLRASKKRVGRRVRKLQAPLRMQARLPFAPQADTYAVADVSINGLAFEAAPDTWLAVGMVVPTLDLRLPQGTVRARGVVRNVRPVGGKLSVGLALQDLAPAHAKTLSDFVDAQVYPHARPAATRDLPQLWDLYRQHGLPPQPLTPKAVSRFESLRGLLLGRGGALLTQVVLGDQELQATAELIRIGEKALRLQHVAARTDPPTPLDAALPPLIGAALKRSDWSFVQALLSMPAGGAFDSAPFEAAAGSKHVGWRVWAAGRGKPSTAEAQLEAEVREASDEDRAWAVGRLERLLHPNERRALDLMGERQLIQGELARVYRGLGLEYTRRVRLASSVSEALGFALVELTPAGLALDGFLPAARLFVTAQEPQRRRDALLALLHDAHKLLAAAGHPPAFFLTPEDAALLAGGAGIAWGAVLELWCEREVATELPRYLQLLGDANISL
jgi:hypothetical protein